MKASERYALAVAYLRLTEENVDKALIHKTASRYKLDPAQRRKLMSQMTKETHGKARTS